MKPITKNQLVDFWMKNFMNKYHCGLCGNKGTVDTRLTAITAAGVYCGGIMFCLCPNGRLIKKHSEKK